MGQLLCASKFYCRLEYTNVFSKTPHSAFNYVCQTAFKILRSRYLILLTVTRCAARISVSFPGSFHREWFPCRYDFTPNTEIYIMCSTNLSHYILKTNRKNKCWIDKKRNCLKTYSYFQKTSNRITQKLLQHLGTSWKIRKNQ